jgi:hypothetical protein
MKKKRLKETSKDKKEDRNKKGKFKWRLIDSSKIEKLRERKLNKKSFNLMR